MGKLLTSERNIVLVTQIKEGRYLTVEDYCKWYDYYLVDNGNVTPINEIDNEKIEDILLNFSGDHCISPDGFVKIANELNAYIDEKSLGVVIVRFLTDHLDSNGAKLNEYMPTEDMLTKVLGIGE